MGNFIASILWRRLCGWRFVGAVRAGEGVKCGLHALSRLGRASRWEECLLAGAPDTCTQVYILLYVYLCTYRVLTIIGSLGRVWDGVVLEMHQSIAVHGLQATSKRA